MTTTETSQPESKTPTKEPFHQTEMWNMYQAGQISKDQHFALIRQFTAGFGQGDLFALPDKQEALGIARILVDNPDLTPPQAAKNYQEEQQARQAQLSQQQQQPVDDTETQRRHVRHARNA